MEPSPGCVCGTKGKSRPKFLMGLVSSTYFVSFVLSANYVHALRHLIRPSHFTEEALSLSLVSPTPVKRRQHQLSPLSVGLTALGFATELDSPATWGNIVPLG